MRFPALVAIGILQLAGASVATAAPQQAQKQPEAVPAPTPATKSDARDRFALGLRLFERGENAAALAEFKRAYELVPNPLVLYNIGLVYAAMDRAVEAVDTLERFLKEGGNAAAGEPGQRARQTRDEQSKRVGQLMVTTNKPAAIEIDGIEAGRTPMQQPVRLTSGTHVVAALAPGCLPLRQEVTLAGQVTRTLDLTLLPTESNVAHLLLTANVPGADIVVNGKKVGVTPLGASVAVAPGAATVEARRRGYRPVVQTVKLDEGARGAVNLMLVEDPAMADALKGRVRLVISETVPEVSVDGVDRPDALAGLALVAGPHLIRVRRGGFAPFERQIDVAAGRETMLVVNLVPTPETKVHYQEAAHTRRIWGWSLIGAGAALAGGAAIFASANSGDLSNARNDLNGHLAMERDITNPCFFGGPRYEGYGCKETKAYYESEVDSAELKRALAFGGVGLGLASAAVGAYLLMSNDAGKYDHLPQSHVSLWGNGQGAGVIASGRF